METWRAYVKWLDSVQPSISENARALLVEGSWTPFAFSTGDRVRKFENAEVCVVEPEQYPELQPQRSWLFVSSNKTSVRAIHLKYAANDWDVADSGLYVVVATGWWASEESLFIQSEFGDDPVGYQNCRIERRDLKDLALLEAVELDAVPCRVVWTPEGTIVDARCYESSSGLPGDLRRFVWRENEALVESSAAEDVGTLEPSRDWIHVEPDQDLPLLGSMEPSRSDGHGLSSKSPLRFQPSGMAVVVGANGSHLVEADHNGPFDVDELHDEAVVTVGTERLVCVETVGAEFRWTLDLSMLFQKPTAVLGIRYVLGGVWIVVVSKAGILVVHRSGAIHDVWRGNLSWVEAVAVENEVLALSSARGARIEFQLASLIHDRVPRPFDADLLSAEVAYHSALLPRPDAALTEAQIDLARRRKTRCDECRAWMAGERHP